MIDMVLHIIQKQYHVIEADKTLFTYIISKYMMECWLKAVKCIFNPKPIMAHLTFPEVHTNSFSVYLPCVSSFSSTLITSSWDLVLRNRQRNRTSRPSFAEAAPVLPFLTYLVWYLHISTLNLFSLVQFSIFRTVLILRWLERFSVGDLIDSHFGHVDFS